MRGSSVKTVLIGDIGINHNASMDNVKALINAAKKSGLDYVKFQKRTPELCVPIGQRDKIRETPWGTMTYFEYRQKMELSIPQYLEIDRYCKRVGMRWFASVWDVHSLDNMAEFDNDYIKIPSACVTNKELLAQAKDTGIPLIVSTGGCDMEMVDDLVSFAGNNIYCLMHCTSTYPCKSEEVNLNCINSYRKYEMPIGFSNHAPSIVPIVAAATLGASMIEFHITLDRSMWGTDQAASFDPPGIERIVRYTRTLETMMGTGVKTFYDSERPVMEKLRT
jgi:N-acetylneuraminate synthase